MSEDTFLTHPMLIYDGGSGHRHKDIDLIAGAEKMLKKDSDQLLFRVNPKDRAGGSVVPEASGRSEREIIQRVAAQAPAPTLKRGSLRDSRLDVSRLIFRHLRHGHLGENFAPLECSTVEHHLAQGKKIGSGRVHPKLRPRIFGVAGEGHNLFPLLGLAALHSVD